MVDKPSQKEMADTLLTIAKRNPLLAGDLIAIMRIIKALEAPAVEVEALTEKKTLGQLFIALQKEMSVIHDKIGVEPKAKEEHKIEQ